MDQQDSRNNLKDMHWVGMDVAKGTFDAALVLCSQHYPDTPLRAVPVESFERSPQGVKALLLWLDSQGMEEENLRVVMEATGRYSSELAVWILAQRPALRPAIVNPQQTSAFINSMGVRNKTDRLEARALGFYGVERRPFAYEAPTPERAELRELSRYRDSMVRQRTRLKNQMSESCDSTVVQSNMVKRLRHITKDIDYIELKIKQLIGQHQELEEDVKLLTSIYGIAFINATTIMAELGDLRRFELARQLTAFAGMSPRHRQSGSSVRGRSRLCKQGNPRIRQCLYLAAMVSVRGDNSMRQTYHRLIAQGKSRMVALAAVMRKLLVLMRAILISKTPYQPLGITQ